MGRNYVGHNFIGHALTGAHRLSRAEGAWRAVLAGHAGEEADRGHAPVIDISTHNCTGHNHTGHNYIGHD